MVLREYRQEDAEIICSWITDEESLYEWNAAWFGSYPLKADDLHTNHINAMSSGRFMAFTYADGDDLPAGHLIIRYPEPDDDTCIRFGYVIIDPELRGNGLGRKMLAAACEYSKTLHASKATIAVFTRNEKAMHCYTAAGFRKTGETEMYHVPLGDWECVVLEKELI